MLTPIETSYMGYRFRSRLEARWAVFFNTLGVKFEYEKEGFKLGVAGWYLPDFWIPAWDMWVEIKPAAPFQGEYAKGCELSKQTNKEVLFVCGNPWPEDYFIGRCFPYEAITDGEDEFEIDRDLKYEFSSCRKCNGICLSGEDDSCATIGTHACGDNWKPGSDIDGILKKAFQAARSARFEHNERNL